MGHLTTHVLDVTSGRPAGGMAIELLAIDGATQRSVCTVQTNADGRCDGPLLEGADFKAGVWELAFHVADYFAATGMTLATPPFLDVVRVRFGIADADETYHVPLLVTPWSYSTYRGS